VADDEPLARYVIAADRISWKAEPKIKEKAFTPQHVNGGDELSTYRTRGLTAQLIEVLGLAYVVSEKNPQVIGWATLPASKVREAWEQLYFDTAPDPDPAFRSHERHVNIKGWPAEKAHLLSIKQSLADAAELSLTATGNQILAEKQNRQG
jgi:hypothetical protein